MKSKICQYVNEKKIEPKNRSIFLETTKNKMKGAGMR